MMGVHVVHVIGDLRMVGAVMACMLVTVSPQSATNNQDTQLPSSLQHTNIRHRRTVGGGDGRDSNPFQQLVDALQSGDMSNAADLYMQYTPTTPAPDNINCYVEVPTTVRIGGRCVQMGGRGGRGRASRNRPWTCQAGIHMDFSPNCTNPNRRRARRPGRG